MNETSAQRDAPATVLIVDDEAIVLRAVNRVLTNAGLRTLTANSGQEAIATVRQRGDEIDVVLTDLHLGDASGMDVLAASRAESPDAVVVVMTALGTIAAAVEAMRAGAYDFLVKPLDPIEALVSTVARAVERKRLSERNRFLERRLAQATTTHGIIGESAPVRRLLSLIDTVAPADTTVLILGESGTGKELVARALHERSGRGARPFLAINCGALTESVLESELFGHVRGAFTGAVSSRKGIFEEAAGGTVFLDEIGEMAPATQVRLLRVLEQREVKPVGSNEARKIDVRVLAATHRDLLKATGAGTFREDLYYRLNVVSLVVPPLRERREDVPLLVHHFVARFSATLGRATKRVDEDALAALVAHPWPGNIRELQNAIERAVLLSRGESIECDDLPPTLAVGASRRSVVERPYALPIAAAVEAFEHDYLQRVLGDAKGNIAEAARFAGVDRSNFRRLLKRHGIVQAHSAAGSSDTGGGSD